MYRQLAPNRTMGDLLEPERTPLSLDWKNAIAYLKRKLPPYPGFHFLPRQTVREVFPHTAYRLSFLLERSKSLPHNPGR